MIMCEVKNRYPSSTTIVTQNQHHFQHQIHTSTITNTNSTTIQNHITNPSSTTIRSRITSGRRPINLSGGKCTP
jgi:hypothetical protein